MLRMPEVLLPSGLSVVTKTDKRSRQPIDYEASIRALQVLQEQQARTEVAQKECNIKINTQDPVAITFFGDTHIGNYETDHARLLESFKKIKSTRNMFMAFTGDIADNMSWVRENGISQATTEIMQGEIAMQAMSELDEAGKVLFQLDGNHDHFVRSFMETYFGKVTYPLLGINHGTAHIQVGDQNYDVLAFHKITMGNSSMSPFLRCQRALEYFNPNADIVVAGHTHRLAVGRYAMGVDGSKKMRTMIETGTMKPEEFFQRSQGNVRTSQFDYCGAGVILFPDQHRIEAYDNLDSLTDGLNGFNAMRNVLTAYTGDTIKRR